jgi:hypothetical protein
MQDSSIQSKVERLYVRANDMQLLLKLSVKSCEQLSELRVAVQQGSCVSSGASAPVELSMYMNRWLVSPAMPPCSLARVLAWQADSRGVPKGKPWACLPARVTIVSCGTSWIYHTIHAQHHASIGRGLNWVEQRQTCTTHLQHGIGAREPRSSNIFEASTC